MGRIRESERLIFFPRAAPPWLGWGLHELLCRTCSNWLVVYCAALWRKKQANREILLLACAFGPFSADLAVRVTGCYVVPAALRLRLVLLALFFLFFFLLSPKARTRRSLVHLCKYVVAS